MSKLADIVAQSKGKFLTVVFYKKDNSIRSMNCRLGVTKYLKGGQSTLDKDKFIIVYDMVKKGYRAIDKESIISVTVGGSIFNEENIQGV